MVFAVFVLGGKFDAGNEIRRTVVFDERGHLFTAGTGVVVGEGKYINTSYFDLVKQFFRRVCSVGKDRMHVKVRFLKRKYIFRHKTPPFPFAPADGSAFVSIA